jgi:hypothetical protein
MPFGQGYIGFWRSDWLSVPQEEELRNNNYGMAIAKRQRERTKRNFKRAFSRLSPN